MVLIGDTTMYEVIEGFGDVVDAPETCWGVELIEDDFETLEEANSFAELHYEVRMKYMEEDWQQFWVVVRKS